MFVYFLLISKSNIKLGAGRAVNGKLFFAKKTSNGYLNDSKTIHESLVSSYLVRVINNFCSELEYEQLTKLSWNGKET